MPTAPYYAGLDIGGTTIKSILIDSTGEQCGDLVEVRSHGHEGYRKTLSQLLVALDTLCENISISRNDVAGIGVDVPAPCSKGVIWGQANLSKDWVGTNIQEELSEAADGKPVFMMNDCNAAAFGEWVLRPNHDGPLLFVAPGTGLGGGFVLPGGTPYEGANGLAMEVGAMSVPHRDEQGNLPSCAGKGDGSVEAWVSLMALRRELQVELSKDENQDHPLAKEDAPIAEKAFQLRDYAEKGDNLALEIFQKQANILGHALADQASELDPGLIVIGGGLAETGFRDWYLEAIKHGFKARAPKFYITSPIPPHEETTRFEWAVGGDAAAAIGVAKRALDARA